MNAPTEPRALIEVIFSCGHRTRWPHDWTFRARHGSKPDDDKYWADNASRPAYIGAVRPCPLCPRRESQHVWGLRLLAGSDDIRPSLGQTVPRDFWTPQSYWVGPWSDNDEEATA